MSYDTGLYLLANKDLIYSTYKQEYKYFHCLLEPVSMLSYVDAIVFPPCKSCGVYEKRGYDDTH